MQTVDFKVLPLQAGDRVLDVGCGEGRHTINAYLSNNVFAIGVDLKRTDLLTAKERLLPFYDETVSQKTFSVYQATALHLPFADNSFDKVICSEVLEHIHDFESVLLEINRVLKPGGLLAVSVPRYWPERICWWLSSEYHQVEGGHIRIFKSSALRSAIEKQGLCFFYRHWAHALHVPFWWLKCLFWQRQDENWFIKLYHRLLVWDLMHKPWLTNFIERCLNPILGKSVVMYFKKPESQAI